jgi:hypothetical protein
LKIFSYENFQVQSELSAGQQGSDCKAQDIAFPGFTFKGLANTYLAHPGGSAEAEKAGTGFYSHTVD